METMLGMGMEDGLTQAIGQIDALVAPARVLPTGVPERPR
jgi:hypothetical protein